MLPLSAVSTLCFILSWNCDWFGLWKGVIAINAAAYLDLTVIGLAYLAASSLLAAFWFESPLAAITVKQQPCYAWLSQHSSYSVVAPQVVGLQLNLATVVGTYAISKSSTESNGQGSMCVE